MKKFILTSLLIIACATCALSQKGYASFYHKYELEKEINCFKISPGFFKFMMDKGSDDYKENLIHKMREVSFLVADSPAPSLIKDFSKSTPKKHYKSMMEIKDGGSTVSFLAKESGKKIEELLLTVEDESSLFVMCIKGDFDKDDAKKIIKTVNLNKAKQQGK